MVEHGTALVPTLINIENFPGIADGGGEVSDATQRHMRDLYAARADRASPPRARPACRSMRAPMRAAWSRTVASPTRSTALEGIGMTPTEALGAACWDAREWLGRPGLEHGAPADLVCYADDPRSGPDVLAAPSRVILRGRRLLTASVHPRS